jgi:anaerobic glycerol-3-phosphate dehydrogenase
MIAGTRCDVLVIGHGAAGCMAAAALASSGLDVIMVGRGTPATEMSTARITVPADDPGIGSIIRTIGRGHGLYGSSAGRAEAITSIGTVTPQDLTSPHDWLALPGDRVAVLGLRGDGSLDPDLACRSLSCRFPSLECDPYWADLGLPAAVDAGRSGALSEAAMEAVDTLGEAISDLNQEIVVLPPLFTGPLYDEALTRLEAVSGRMVREPATPMSSPGRRLQECLGSHAVGSGCRFLRGREVISIAFDGCNAVSAVVRSGLREQEIGFRAAVLAAGSLVGGGLAVSGDSILDPMGAFAVGGPSGDRSGLGPLSRALSSGIAHRNGLAVRTDGRVAENVLVTGSSLPGISFPQGMGLGHVLSSALSAAGRVKEVL